MKNKELVIQLIKSDVNLRLIVEVVLQSLFVQHKVEAELVVESAPALEAAANTLQNLLILRNGTPQTQPEVLLAN